MADKSSQLVLEALSRAVADPAGVPLFTQKTSPGLFGGTATARHAAQRCKEQDLLRVVRTEARGRAVHEVVAITPKGIDHLLDKAGPRQVLEDLVRAVEARDSQLGELIDTVQRAQASLHAMKEVATTVLRAGNSAGTPAPGEVAPDLIAAQIVLPLEEWHSANAAKDCPLPQLYRLLPPLSIGVFHDALRLLHEQHQVYLHPWTGPLYAIPEPPYALLVGHQVAYYASSRK